MGFLARSAERDAIEAKDLEVPLGEVAGAYHDGFDAIVTGGNSRGNGDGAGKAAVIHGNGGWSRR